MIETDQINKSSHSGFAIEYETRGFSLRFSGIMHFKQGTTETNLTMYRLAVSKDLRRQVVCLTLGIILGWSLLVFFDSQSVAAHGRSAYTLPKQVPVQTCRWLLHY